jgi:hypothetical protein
MIPVPNNMNPNHISYFFIICPSIYVYSYLQSGLGRIAVRSFHVNKWAELLSGDQPCHYWVKTDVSEISALNT